MAKIELRGIYKIFGSDPEAALAMVRGGANKDEVLEKAGHTIGLADVNLSIESGRIFVIMGLSGSGKSTLIRHLNRLIEPTAGEITVDGEDILALDGKALGQFRRRRMSMVFQRFGLFPHRSVLENVAFGLDIQAEDRTARERAKEQAREWIDTVGLGGYEGAYPHELSGGMQQRVGLARALATDADILLMDEAFSALDPLIRRDMQDQLLDLQARLNKTIIFITHDLDEALRLGDRIAILKDGEVMQVGTAEDILTKPADAHVAAFVEDVNRGRVLTAGRVKLDCEIVRTGTTPTDALDQIREGAFKITYLVDANGKLVGALTAEGARRAVSEKAGSLTDFTEPVPEAAEDMVLEEVLALTLKSAFPIAVIDEAGQLCGMLPKEEIIKALAEPAQIERGDKIDAV